MLFEYDFQSDIYSEAHPATRQTPRAGCYAPEDGIALSSAQAKLAPWVPRTATVSGHCAEV